MVPILGRAPSVSLASRAPPSSIPSALRAVHRLPVDLAFATMLRPMKPWTFFLTAMAGWMNRRQQEVIEYLKEEIVAVAVIPAGRRAPWSHRERAHRRAQLWLTVAEFA